MTTRISSDGPQPTFTVEPTAHRTTPAPGRPFQALMTTGARAVVDGAEAAAAKLPGGPVVVAAVRDGTAGATSLLAVDSGGGAVGRAPTGGAAPGSEPGGVENALARQAEDSLYFLNLQQRIQEETRNYQAVSNVLKARHESVKNAIGNLR